MPRMARVVVPDYPHHVTQRGNRRQPVFFCDEDYAAYLDLVQASAKETDLAILAYCLMPNHVHFVAVPKDKDGLRNAFAGAHQRYTRRINFREGWRGYLWQGRFHSYAMDENHLLAAVRYIELNPVRAGLCQYAAQWRWSSVHAHLTGDDEFVSVQPMLGIVNEWSAYLGEKEDDSMLNGIRLHSGTGRPLGDARFMDEIEQLLGYAVRKKRAGRKPMK